jgi:hypothetical protein
VWVEIMGPGKYEHVGKSQSVLMMINPIIFTRTRMGGPAQVLTFHHLVPKETHASVLKRSPTPSSLGLPADTPLPPGGMKELLQKHGSWLCRPCHSAVHRFAGAQHHHQHHSTVAPQHSSTWA